MGSATYNMLVIGTAPTLTVYASDGSSESPGRLGKKYTPLTHSQTA